MRVCLIKDFVPIHPLGICNVPILIIDLETTQSLRYWFSFWIVFQFFCEAFITDCVFAFTIDWRVESGVLLACITQNGSTTGALTGKAILD